MRVRVKFPNRLIDWEEFIFPICSLSRGMNTTDESSQGQQPFMEQAQDVCMAHGITLFQMLFDFIGSWNVAICLGPFRF